MVQITQTKDKIKIIIALNRYMTQKPDVILMPKYIKFHYPPIFFEGNLIQEIDEVHSFCRIFKKEAHVTLLKKSKEIWPEIFASNLCKDELIRKRLQIVDDIIETNNRKDQHRIDLFERKKRLEINKEIRRETTIRERLSDLENQSCQETLVQKEKTAQEKLNDNNKNDSEYNKLQLLANVRRNGVINFSFSNFNLSIPKRESRLNSK